MVVTVAQARELILSLEGATAAPHMDREAFRAGGTIFASLRDDGVFNVKLTLEDQALRCEAAPTIFSPVAGGWGKMGYTSINLALADDLDVKSALLSAWTASQPVRLPPREKKKKSKPTTGDNSSRDH
jgi:hypothetical protein